VSVVAHSISLASRYRDRRRLRVRAFADELGNLLSLAFAVVRFTVAEQVACDRLAFGFLERFLETLIDRRSAARTVGKLGVDLATHRLNKRLRRLASPLEFDRLQNKYIFLKKKTKQRAN
jgi:hypothetical protein